MMKIRKVSDIIIDRFVVGPMEVNSYCVTDPATKDTCIIDPGAEPERIIPFLNKKGRVPKFIINTHGHGDHIAANGYLDLPIYIHRLDREYLEDPEKNLSKLFLFPVSSPGASRLMEDGDVINLGESKLEIIHTPGHTPGSVSIKTDGVIFTGDALFRGGIGRTDLYGGNEKVLLESIRRRLLIFSDDTVIYPGHGEPSTIGEERRNNPFLQ